MTAASAAARARKHWARAVDRMFSGHVDARVYDLVRIGIAAVFLVRHSDWLRPLLQLEHHRFVHGLLFLGSSAAEPRLHSPLALFVALGDGANDALVYARTALALALLLGFRTRYSALLLGLCSFVLLGADRYRYYHHLYLLYTTVLCLALTPDRTPFSIDALLGRTPAERVRAFWPLAMLRALTLSVYLAAGVSKIDAGWLRGEALEHLSRLHLLGGAPFEAVRGLLGNAGLAWAIAIAELGLPVLLIVRRTRRLAVLLSWALHAGISLSLPVYSFGFQMAFLVFTFWPEPSAVQVETRARGVA